MPVVIDIADPATASLDEVTDALAARGFDPGDPESLHHAARQLRRLGNDQQFLGALLIDELASRHKHDNAPASYGAQVIMLSPPNAGEFFIRANIWPSQGEHTMRSGGSSTFAYALPHDHNFSFLTLGYFGPGYWSNYYEYDYESAIGYHGEPVDLRFIEKARLDQGKIQLYRAHIDVHDQLPPDALSVSLNIMHTSGAQGWLDQYSFDIENRRIGRILSTGSSEAFLQIAVGLGCDEARDLASRFGNSHPSDRMRLAAWSALVSVETEPNARDAIWREAECGGSQLVTMEARKQREKLAELA
jgi:hypothetical protein